MNKNHLHILHLNNTGIQKIDDVCQTRYGNLMSELIEQEITDFTIWNGEYDAVNTKQAIHKGHRKIVQYAKDNKLSRVIIAEDDIVFTHPNSYRYFLSQIPDDFDLFFGVLYQAELCENRVLNGFSGGCSLYVVSERFYSTFLSQPIDTHVDRQLGMSAYLYKFYVCAPQVVIQRGGFSYNLHKEMYYWPYMEGKSFYGKDNQVCINGEWKAG